MAASYEEGASKHREFLKKRQKASDEGRAYPATRTTKEVTEARDTVDTSQRRDMEGSPIKLKGLRERFKRKRKR